MYSHLDFVRHLKEKKCFCRIGKRIWTARYICEEETMLLLSLHFNLVLFFTTFSSYNNGMWTYTFYIIHYKHQLLHTRKWWKITFWFFSIKSSSRILLCWNMAWRTHFLLFWHIFGIRYTDVCKGFKSF